MRLVGTSGYNYDAWKGSFYPERLAKTKMLPFYATQFSTVEINYSFYRLPSAKTLTSWGAQTPPEFRFALKAWQRITHERRLLETRALVEQFAAVARLLGDKLGPILYQLPPTYKKDAARLADFLHELPAGLRAAFEFRHSSWFSDDVFELLRGAGSALCIADTDELTTPFVRTAPFGYLRLRRLDYQPAALASWAAEVDRAGFSDVFIYFKHEEGALGPRFARQLLRKWTEV